MKRHQALLSALLLILSASSAVMAQDGENQSGTQTEQTQGSEEEQSSEEEQKAAEERDKSKEEDKSKNKRSETFIPSEEISEDLSVSFPVDI